MRVDQYTLYTLPLWYFRSSLSFDSRRKIKWFSPFLPFKWKYNVLLSTKSSSPMNWNQSTMIERNIYLPWQLIGASVRLCSIRNSPEFYASKRNINKLLIAIAYDFDGYSLMFGVSRNNIYINHLPLCSYFCFCFCLTEKWLNSSLSHTHNIIWSTFHLILTDRQKRVCHRIFSLFYRVHVNGNHITLIVEVDITDRNRNLFIFSTSH